MKNVARAFNPPTNDSILRGPQKNMELSNSNDLPWGMLADGAMPPMMFELRFHDGSLISYAYSDIREIRCPNAGCVEIFLHAMGKLVITIEGRHLRDLASHIGCAMIHSIQEADPRNPEKPDETPDITKIMVEEIEG